MRVQPVGLLSVLNVGKKNIKGKAVTLLMIQAILCGLESKAKWLIVLSVQLE